MGSKSAVTDEAIKACTGDVANMVSWWLKPLPFQKTYNGLYDSLCQVYLEAIFNEIMVHNPFLKTATVNAAKMQIKVQVYALWKK